MILRNEDKVEISILTLREDVATNKVIDNHYKINRLNRCNLNNDWFFQLKAQGVGNTVLTLSKEEDFSGGDAGVSATNAEIRTRLNLIENAINNFVTPTCS